MSSSDPDTDGKDSLRLRCVATVRGKNVERRKDAVVARRCDNDKLADSWMKSLQFSADGSTVITQNDRHELQTFALRLDLLETEQQPPQLESCASVASPTSLLSFAIYPGYNLHNSNSLWVLSGESSLPIQLRHALNYNYAAQSYPWIHKTTEAQLGASSLAFVQSGTHFAAGSRGHIAVFDVSRPGQSPVTNRKTYREPAGRDNGLVMGLAMSSDGLLAAGTTNRNITLRSGSGQGEVELAFSLQPPPGATDECPGSGVTSLAWSPCERYLLIAERQSDCIQIFDVRQGGHLLSWLSNRNAMSTQRFDFSVIPTQSGCEVWSGGIDGSMRMWRNIGTREGEHQPELTRKVSDLPVGGTSWQPQGAVLATCSGGHTPPAAQPTDTIDEAHNTFFDTMNLWTVSGA